MNSELRGAGPLTVFLHGWSAEISVWGSFADLPGRASLLFDLPGHGATPWVPGFTLRDLARSVLDALPGPADFVGWSLGGVVSLACAAEDPAKVRSVSVLAMSNFGGDRAVRMRAALARDRNKALLEFYKAVWSEADRRRPGFDELQKELARKRRLPSVEAMVGLYDTIEAGLAGLDLARVVCPVAILHGTADAISPLSRAHEVAAQIPGARVFPIEGAGHAPFLTFPAECRSALENFWVAKK